MLPLSFILYACPFESTVPLEPWPVESIDTNMLGYWYGIIKDGSDYFGIEALDITRQTDSSYSIIRYGKSVKGDIILPDTAYFTGYTSYIEQQRFMNIEGSVVITTQRRNKSPEVKTEKIYYLAALEMNHDTLIVKTIIENFSPSRKGFKNPEELKLTLIDLIGQKKNIFDDLYSLSYHKIQKPQPFVKPF